jgi:hypothetical protein
MTTSDRTQVLPNRHRALHRLALTTTENQQTNPPGKSRNTPALGVIPNPFVTVTQCQDERPEFMQWTTPPNEKAHRGPRHAVGHRPMRAISLPT